MAAIEEARTLIDEMREQLTECEGDAKNLLLDDLHEDAKLLADAAVELADLAGRLVQAWQARPAGNDSPAVM